MDKLDISSKLYDYSVEFVDDFKTKLNEFQKDATYIIDNNVYKLYKDNFKYINYDLIYLMEPIESKKNINTVLDIIYFWKKIKLKKNWRVVCIGGGITQDVTTFACNIFLRNIDWYFFPTTLLSMCDSCIGGKCGINLEEYKNQLGVFYPPKKIIISKQFIETLSKEDYINGWGEILKFSLTSYNDFYETISRENSFVPCKSIERYIYRGLSIKKEIIEQDEFESDLRRVLNYGHTFGHALESYTENKVPHGTAVIWGIDVVNYISYRLNKLSQNEYFDIKKLIKRAFLPQEIIIDNGIKLFNIIKTDKKVKNNTIYLALLTKISKLEIYPMNINKEFEKLFLDYLETTHEYYSD